MKKVIVLLCLTIVGTRLLTWFFLTVLLIAVSTLTHAQGYPQGQPVEGNSTNVLASSPIFIDATQFPAATPCTQIINAIAAVPTALSAIGGTDIDARGIGNNVTFSGATNPGCGVLDSNFMKNTATAMVTTGTSGNAIKGGTVHLGGYTLQVSLVPSELGACAPGAGIVCATGPQFPPGAVILIPNKVRGLEGIGRGDAGLLNTNIELCTGNNAPASGCKAPVQRNWSISGITASTAGGRNYMAVTVTANSSNTNTSGNVDIVGNGTLGTATLADYLASGQLSSGQTVSISGGTFGSTAVVVCFGNGVPAACPGSGVSAPTINSSGKVVFNFPTTFNGHDTSDTITIGSNIVPGEYVMIAGAIPTSTNDNGTWRVCSTSNSNGTDTDQNCPGNPTNTSFSVVGTKASLSTFMRARDSVMCTSNCGSVYAEIPIVDLGDPQTAAGKFQFATGIRDLTLNVNANTAIFPAPTVSGISFRNIASDEQTEVRRVLMNNFSLWAADVHGTVNQNAQEFADVEMISGGDANNYCQPGQAGTVFGDIGPRHWDGWTVNFGGCSNLSPIAGLFVDIPTNTDITNGHSENVQFAEILGQNYPSQSNILTGNGGQATGSAVYLNGSCVSPPCPSTNIIGSYDGPYQSSGTLNGAITAGANKVVSVSGLNPSTQCSTLENSVILDVCTAPHMPNTLCLGANTFCSPGDPCSINGGNTLGGEASTITATTSTSMTVANVKYGHPSGSVIACSAPPAALGISGNFPTQINGNGSAFTGDYTLLGYKKNTAAFYSIADDYTGAGSTDPFVSMWIVDTNGSGGCRSRHTTSGTVPSLFCGLTHVIGSLQQTTVADLSITATTTATATTVASWTLPAMTTAQNYSFTCDGSFTQSNANGGVTFTIQGATTQPTNLVAQGTAYLSPTTVTSGSSGNIITTTATNILSATITAAVGTILPLHITGTVELPANAAGNTVLTLGGFTANALDPLVVKRGFACTLY